MNIQSTAASLPPQANLVVVSPAARDVKTTGETRTADPTLTLLPVQPPDRTQLEAATQSVRDFVKPINDNLEFSVDGDSGQLVVKIIDSATKEVIRQVPSQEMLAIAKALDSIKGLFVKQSA